MSGLCLQPGGFHRRPNEDGKSVLDELVGRLKGMVKLIGNKYTSCASQSRNIQVHCAQLPGRGISRARGR